jgi:hypothetical protein
MGSNVTEAFLNYMLRAAAMVAVVLLVAGAAAFVLVNGSNGPGKTTGSSSRTSVPETSVSSTSASTASTTSIPAVSLSNSTSFCTFPGEPQGILLRVLSDSDSTPVVGAHVTTSYEFPYTCVPGANVASTTSQAFESFTTTSTEWYYLHGLNDGTYSFSVEYGGQTYNLTATPPPGAYGCVTLQVPSGAVDTTYAQSCPATGS